jgi:hypothetical protein
VKTRPQEILIGDKGTDVLRVKNVYKISTNVFIPSHGCYLMNVQSRQFSEMYCHGQGKFSF